MAVIKVVLRNASLRFETTENSTFADLLGHINLKTSSNYDQGKICIRVGYPPKILSGIRSNETLQGKGITTGMTIYVEEGLTPSFISSQKERLLEMGYNERVCDHAISLVGENDTLTVEICQHLADEESEASTLSQKSARSFRRHIIDADNSCLFNAIGYLLCGDSKNLAPLYRSICSEAITSNVKYSEVVLGKAPPVYAAWILNSDEWGGEIEMDILSSQLGVQISAVDIKTGSVYRYGIEDSLQTRIYLMYDGIHYDAIVEDATSQEGGVVTIFASDDTEADAGAKAVAAELRSKARFVDLSTFTIQCLVCREPFKGQTEAMNHAKDTGHQNFGQC